MRARRAKKLERAVRSGEKRRGRRGAAGGGGGRVRRRGRKEANPRAAEGGKESRDQIFTHVLHRAVEKFSSRS